MYRVYYVSTDNNLDVDVRNVIYDIQETVYDWLFVRDIRGKLPRWILNGCYTN
jgi:hypothetical protein